LGEFVTISHQHASAFELCAECGEEAWVTTPCQQQTIGTLKDVLDAERQEIQRLRGLRKVDLPEDAPVVGLAFSGGGIRSATINLGILQGLAKFGLLKRVDYLSTVSGGGYIGGWLARWIYERGIDNVQERLGEPEKDAEKVEPEPVTFLRDYSNYLTPRKGLLGADTWAAIASYIRNVWLNQSILVAFLGAVLFIPWILGGIFEYGPLFEPKPLIFAGFAALLVIFAVATGVVHTSTCAGVAETQNDKADAAKNWEWTSQRCVLIRVVLPLFAGAFCLNYTIFREPDSWNLPLCLFSGLAVYTLGHFAGWLAARATLGWKAKGLPSLWNVFCALPAGALAGWEVYGLKLFVARWFEDPTEGKWHAVSWGPPLFVLAFLIAGGLHIGLAKFALRNEIHEWWARLGGWLLLWSLCWAAIFALAIFVPVLVFQVTQVATGPVLWAKRAAIAGWLAHSGLGAKFGWSDQTSGKPNGTAAKEWIAKLAPYVFVAGLLIALATAAHTLALAASGLPLDGPELAAQQLQADKDAAWWFYATAISSLNFLGLAVGLGILAAFLSWRVDINRFSMNLLYRNRLVRCYLGASNEHRGAQPFTGFDPADDVNLACFSEADACDPDEQARRPEGYDGPYPILNATLNVTHGQRLGWQERKAESFIFTPRYCGFDYPEMKESGNQKLAGGKGAAGGGYHRTKEWAMREHGVTLGTAIATSGAAVSPNMGFHTYPPLAFLMTVFNVRLGEWLANPRFANDQFLEPISWALGKLKKYLPGAKQIGVASAKRTIGSPEGGPRSALFYLLCELFGTTTDVSKYVYLTDGAHFENLAIYELVKRECGYIIASDAGEDSGYVFSDLANAIRKCRTDLGAEIDLKLGPFTPNPETGFAKYHAIRGEIRYRSGKKGEILYFKSCLTGGEPNDVKDYRRLHKEFPQQSTANQWFDESQFESYRALGLFAANSILERSGETAPGIERVFAAAPLE